MEKKSNAKRELILSKAKQVFLRKGFATVTMKDIIEECGISRGGIYLYFQSVDEIFMHVIEAHSQQKIREAKQYITSDMTFEQVINEFLAKQKKRLMNLENSFLVAMYEYRFAYRNEEHKDFFQNQFTYTKNIVVDILNFGFKERGFVNHNVDMLATSIVLLIEGISMLAIVVGVPEAFIDKQIMSIKFMIDSHMSDGSRK